MTFIKVEEKGFDFSIKSCHFSYEIRLLHVYVNCAISCEMIHTHHYDMS